MASRRAKVVWLCAMGLSVAAIVAAAYVHHSRRGPHVATATPIEMSARFLATISPIQMTLEMCVSMLDVRGFSVSGAHAYCDGQTSYPWFQAEVTNVGDQGAWLTRCSVKALGGDGKLVFEGLLNVGPIAPPAGLHVDPGETVQYRWHLVPALLTTPKRVDRYVTSCEPKYYGSIIPP